MSQSQWPKLNWKHQCYHQAWSLCKFLTFECFLICRHQTFKVTVATVPCRRAADLSHWQQRDPRQYEPPPEAALLHTSVLCRAEQTWSVSGDQPRPCRQPGMLLSSLGGYRHVYILQTWVSRVLNTLSSWYYYLNVANIRFQCELVTVLKWPQWCKKTKTHAQVNMEATEVSVYGFNLQADVQWKPANSQQQGFLWSNGCYFCIKECMDASQAHECLGISHEWLHRKRFHPKCQDVKSYV